MSTYIIQNKYSFLSCIEHFYACSLISNSWLSCVRVNDDNPEQSAYENWNMDFADFSSTWTKHRTKTILKSKQKGQKYMHS